MVLHCDIVCLFYIPLSAHISNFSLSLSLPTSLPLPFSFFPLLSLICLSLPFFLQPTTAASQSYRPSLMCEPLNCHPLATRLFIHVSLASIWLEDQSTGPAGLMEAGLGSPLSVQVSTWLHSIQIGRCHLLCFTIYLVPAFGMTHRNLMTIVCKVTLI